MKHLTLKKMTELYEEAKKYDDDLMVIPTWKEPLLWMLFPIFGYTVTSENWKMYWVEFRGVKYLLKSKEQGSLT